MRLKRRVVLLAAGLPLIFAGLVGCGGGGSSKSPAPSADRPVTTRSVYGSLEFTLTVPKTVYKSGEVIAMDFTITNTSNAPVVILPDIAGHGNYYEFVTRNSQQLYSSRFSAGGDSLGLPQTLAPREVLAYKVGWAQNNDRNQQVEPGKYLFYARLDAAGIDAQRFSRTEADALLGPPPIELSIQ